METKVVMDWDNIVKHALTDDIRWVKYRKKPVVIEAIKMDEDFCVETLEGVMKGDAGDYLIRGVELELYPCKPSIFEKSYEKVE
jgi:hypothetical protein